MDTAYVIGFVIGVAGISAAFAGVQVLAIKLTGSTRLLHIFACNAVMLLILTLIVQALNSL